jgi:hypothetical protein
MRASDDNDGQNVAAEVAVTRSELGSRRVTDAAALVEAWAESGRRRLSHHAASSRRLAYTVPRLA